MAVSERTRKRLVNLGYLFAGSFIFGWGVLDNYWNGRLPTVPDASSGRTYALAFHGTYGYVNFTQFIIYNALPVTALVLAFIINRIDQHLDKKFKSASKDIPMSKTGGPTL